MTAYPTNKSNVEERRDSKQRATMLDPIRDANFQTKRKLSSRSRPVIKCCSLQRVLCKVPKTGRWGTETTQTEPLDGNGAFDPSDETKGQSATGKKLAAESDV